MIYWFTGASTQAVSTGAYRAVEFIKANIKLEGVEKASITDSKKVVEICLFVCSAFFVYRSFYGMRIDTSQKSDHREETPAPTKNPAWPERAAAFPLTRAGRDESKAVPRGRLRVLWAAQTTKAVSFALRLPDASHSLGCVAGTEGASSVLAAICVGSGAQIGIDRGKGGFTQL